MNRQFTVLLFFLLFTICGFSQTKYSSRTAHIYVETRNKFMNIEADNYQVASVLDAETGSITLLGLLKSFEFKLGALDQVYNSKLVSTLSYPKFKYVGKIKNIRSINFDRPGKYPIEVSGTLYLWDAKRITPGKGTLEVKSDGSIKAYSDISFMIEEQSVAKADELIKRYLPKGVNVNTDKLGISRKITTKVDATFWKKRSATNSQQANAHK